MADIEVPMFEGRSSRECEVFISAVVQKMFAEGKHKDDNYIAHYVATKMAGKALRWFYTLNDETQESWKLLRREFLSRYPPPSDEECSTGGFTVPVAAAASPTKYKEMEKSFPSRSSTPWDPFDPMPAEFIDSLPEIPSPSIRSDAPLPTGGRVGMLAFVSGDDTYYLSLRLHRKGGYYRVTQEREKALRVALDDSRIITGDPRYKYVGIAWQDQGGPQAIRGAGFAYARFCGMAGETPSFYKKTTLSSADVWEVMEDGKIGLTYEGRQLSVGLDKAGGATAPYVYFGVHPLSRDRPARIVFEDL